MKDYHPPKDLLADRVILVTGAGSGIGRAVSLALAEHGATVVLLGRTVPRLEKVYDEIERLGWPKAAILPLNLETASTIDYEAAAQTVEKEFGRLDGLLHNAALLGTLTPLELYNIETWGRVMQVNLNAPFLLTRACLPLLKNAPDASIVFTSADVGRRSRAYWGAYGVAAFGIEGLMQTLACELETNTRVRVNSLDPGPVRTELRSRAYPGEDPNILPPPESITGTYVYLLGPDSRAVTGQALNAQQAGKPGTKD